MPGFIRSFRQITSDSLFFINSLVLSVILYLPFYLYKNNIFSFNFILTYSLLGVYLLGYFSYLFKLEYKNNNYVVPNIISPKNFLSIFPSIFLMLPYVIIGSLISYLLFNFIEILSIKIISIIIISILSFSFSCLSFGLFLDKNDIRNSFNLKHLLKYWLDYFLGGLFFTFQYSILALILLIAIKHWSILFFPSLDFMNIVYIFFAISYFHFIVDYFAALSAELTQDV